MTTADSPSMFRADLVKAHWRMYAFVCVVSLAAHALWLRKWGIAPSTDFGVRYDPGARQLLAALGFHGFGTATSFSIGAYGWARIGYIAFIAACYATFGAGLGSAVYPQIAIVWLVYPLIFHTLLHITRKPLLAFGAICVWLSYYDSYQWQFRAVPDSLYRFVFVAAFFVLLRLWEKRRDIAFVLVLLAAVAIGTVLRIETALYAMPALFVSLSAARRKFPGAVTAGAIVLLALMWLARDGLSDIFATFIYLQTRGFVLPGSGMVVPGVTDLTAPSNNSVVSWVLFGGHLAVLRFWYAITPLPALWSSGHRLYYATYITSAYVLSGAGLVAAIRARNTTFLICAWIFAAGVILQVFVAVDPSMRYAYTPHVFLFFCAAMGWPAFQRIFSPVVTPVESRAHA